MIDQIRNKLNAYLDGELNERSRAQVEEHLQVCADCRDELEGLRSLSERLQAAPLPEFTTPLDFKNQVILQLPRRESKPDQDNSNVSFLYWVPVFILICWIFVQIVFWFSGETILAGIEPQQTQWFAIYQLLFGGSQGIGNLSLLNQIDLYFFNFILQIFIQAVVGILYGAVIYILVRNQNKSSALINGTK